MWLQPRSLVVGERVYVKDEDYAWLPAKVVATEDDRVLVRLDLPDDWFETTTLASASLPGGSSNKKLTRKQQQQLQTEERWIQLNDYKDRQLPLQNDAPTADMADLRFLHEAAILFQTKQRHLTQKPYTRVGDIVVAVNPCQWIPGLYDAEQQHFYAKNFVWQAEESSSNGISVSEKKEESIVSSVAATSEFTNTSSTTNSSVYERLGVEPHIYEVSASAYRGVLLEQENQTILVSGESGAGKTETVKIVLEHLATLEASSLSPGGGELAVKSNELVQKIIKSSPIFEAFGNAETLRNHNSSRFGKSTRLHFETLENGMLGLCGSTCQTYLLESNRVVSQAENERGFHIFYQFLAAPENIKVELLGEEWKGTTADDFRYLNQNETRDGKGSDSENWSKTLEALTVFDWKEGWLKTLVQALATMLRLGNIVFSPCEIQEQKAGGANGGCKASVDDLALAAQLLEIEPEELEQSMTRRFVEVAHERVEVPLAPEVAKESLDALVKRIYAYMFACLVASINDQTQGTSGDGVISILDIYGFERFDTNRFEQLCINYANERLHKKYVDDNFARFKTEYESEGIEIFDFSKIDNSEVLQLFDGSSGMIGIISEECLRPKGDSLNFVQRMKQMHSENSRFINKKLGGQYQFGVQHFAGPVMYDADHFVERNTDHLPTTLVSTLSKASNEILKGAHTLVLKEKNAPRGSQQKKTVLDKFRMELRDLISSIEETETRYIRCIKPNEPLIPEKVDHNTILRQLKCAGLVTAIDLSRESFPSKIPFELADERFTCLLDLTSRQILKELPLHDRIQFMMSQVFAPVLEVYRNCDFTLPYACGKTRVYFRAGALELLESMRRDYYEARALMVQKTARSFLAKRQYERFQIGLVRLQAKSRAFVPRRNFRMGQACVIALQSMERRRSEQNKYRQMKNASIVIQVHARGFGARKLFQKSKRSANILCAAVRLFLVKRQYNTLVYAAEMIQWAWRNFQHRRLLTRLIKIQSFVRGFLYRSARAVNKQTEEMDQAVVEQLVHLDAMEQLHPGEAEEYINESPDLILSESDESTDGSSMAEKVALVEKSDLLMSEINKRDGEIHQLRNDIAALADDAQHHTQELEAEYEERLVDYEEEVLHLREMIDLSELEKSRLLEEQASARMEHQKTIDRMKAVLRKTQENHKEYLTNITSVLDKATEARRQETDRIMQEIQRVKKQKDSQIVSLQIELKAVKMALDESKRASKKALDSSSRKNISNFANDIAKQKQRLQSLLQPQNIYNTVEKTRKRSPPTKEKIIDQSITQPATDIVEKLLDIIGQLQGS